MKKIDTRQIILTALFCALIAIGTFLRIPLPNGSIITMQFLFVLLGGLICGARIGFLAPAIYLALGLVGFPVFAAGGGIGYLLKPTFGYLISFVFAGWVTGLIAEKNKDEKYVVAVGAALLSTVIVYVFGMAYMYVIMNFYVGKAMTVTALFAGLMSVQILKDIVMVFVASAISVRVRKAVGSLRFANAK